MRSGRKSAQWRPCGAAQRLNQDPVSVTAPAVARGARWRLSSSALAPEGSTLPESTDISGEGLTVVEFNGEPCKFSFQRTINEGSH